MSINKSLVSVFQLLQKYDEESRKFTKLSHLYGTLKFNDKLILKFYNDFQENKNDISKLTYFKNTNINKVLDKMEEEDINILTKSLKDAYKIAKNKIINGEEHTCGDNCNHKEELMTNKKIKKILNKKGMKQQLQAHLGKQFNIKNGNVEDMLRQALKNELPGDQFNMINNALSNPMIKSVTDKLLTEENMNKLKDIFTEVMEDKEIVEEINKIKEIFNETKVMNAISTIFESVKNINDITKIQSLLENNEEIKNLMVKFENAMKSGLIDEKKMMELAKKAGDKMMDAMKETKILDGVNIKLLKNLIGNMGSNFMSKKKELTKEERRDRRIKNNRRRIRAELKKKKNKRKNKKRN